MAGASHRGDLEALWEAYVFNIVGRTETATEDRLQLALEMLALHRQQYANAQAAGKVQDALFHCQHGMVVWTLIALEGAAWLADTPGLSKAITDEQDWEGAERIALRACLKLHEAAIPPTHRDAIDPVPLLLPRWLFVRLRDAIEALQKGEVHPLAQPNIVGRPSDAWTKDAMRLRAVEHVCFLNGQGLSLRIARSRVGTAMKVAAETLREWEAEFRQSMPDRIETARAAGEYKARLDEDPTYVKVGNPKGQSVDAHALTLFVRLREEPLAIFGRRYAERFGLRHYNPESGGN